MTHKNGPAVMKPYNKLCTGCLVGIAIFFGPPPVYSQQVSACASASSDADGDGWGWENNTTCRVIADVGGDEVAGLCVDSDGDGYGWNGSATCLTSVSGVSATDMTTQSSDCVDQDGDGYGWDGTGTCLVTSSGPILNSGDPVTECVDLDGDGYGWDGSQSCIVPLGSVVQEIESTTVFCESSGSDPDGDGVGHENNRACTMNVEYFADVSVGSSLGNPYHIVMGKTFQATAQAESVYFSIDVTSTDPVSISVEEEFYFLYVRQGESAWGGGEGLSIEGPSDTSHFCLPVGTYQIEVQKIPWVDLADQQSLTIKAEQSLATPCAILPESTTNNNVYVDYSERGIYSATSFMLNGFDQNGSEQWSYFSEQGIAKFLKGDDGLVYVYAKHEYIPGESLNRGELDLLIFDPDNLATPEQLAQAQPPVQTVCGVGTPNATTCAGNSIEIESINNIQSETVNVGDIVTGTLAADSDDLSYSMTLNGMTAVTFLNPGSAALSVTESAGRNRRLVNLRGTAESEPIQLAGRSSESNYAMQSLCLPAGTYQIDLSNHRAGFSSFYSFSVQRSDINCIQPIHVATKYPYFDADQYHIFQSRPAPTGVIYHQGYGLAAMDWQGNTLWHKPLWLFDFGVTNDGSVHGKIEHDPFNSEVISYSRYGDTVASKIFNSNGVSVFTRNDSVLVVPHWDSAIEAYDSVGNLLWLHSIPPGDASNGYFDRLLSSQRLIQ